MERLRVRDVLKVLDVLGDVYGARSVEAFRGAVIGGLPRLVDSDIAAYNEIDLRAGRAVFLVSAPEAEFPGSREIFERYMHQNPVLRHHSETGDGRAAKISDFLSRRNFRALDLYNELYRRQGVEHQIVVQMPARAPTVLGIALTRGARDFSERDRACLNLLRPHLIQAFRNAARLEALSREAARHRGALDALGIGVVLLDARRAPAFVNALARATCSRVLGRGRWRARLSTAVRDWLSPHAAQTDLGACPWPSLPPLVIRGDGGAVVVRATGDGSGHVMLMVEAIDPPAPEALAGLGLTRREAHVLIWVAQGKTNGEIAAILDMAPRTVQKHLERVFEKLGVENRTAAAARALEYVRRTTTE